MNSLRISVRRAGSVFAALALVLTTALPGIASAAQVTVRSVELSSSLAGATGVNYNIKFTADGAAGAVVVDFCSNSPLLGYACTAPTGFNISTGTTVSGSFTKDADETTASKLVVTGTITAAQEVSIPVAGVANPTNSGPLYARIVTYTNTTGSDAYTSADPGTHIDDGGVALYITPTIAVSGAVLESMTFCVAGNAITEVNCGGTLNAPQLRLGTDVGGVIALTPTAISEGTIYTQLSTNAVNGAVVNLKSNTTGCGGLSREGAATFAAGCAIAPAGAAVFEAGQAKFGVKLGTAAGVGGAGNFGGTVRPYDSGTGAYYNTSVFKLNYVDNTTGVTGTYGDPLLDTNGAPVNNMNMPITFGASAANNTPAGNYKANLSLIATGKF